ncbi:DNA polymerase III subunit delta [Erysipelothrix anatis]|uniref:DNA polymerase III subunit delta n=1 Tax=Erysipelothrix anatis TaxID=2683713 RepID=UPI00140DD67F|nr:DNA polymerase III subunit delta [Erysipelothrix anatis]
MLDVIYGTDRFQIQEHIKRIENEHRGQHGDFDLVKIDMASKEFHIDQLEEAVMTFSLFGGNKLVVFSHRDKEQKKAPEAELIQLLERSSLEVRIVIIFDKKPLAKTKIKKFLDKHAQNHVLDTVDVGLINQRIRDAIKAQNIQIQEAAIQLLVQRIENDLVQLESELNKLSVLGRPITKEDVNVLVSRPFESEIFKLSNAILDRNVTEAFALYQDFLELKMDPLSLIGLIAFSLRRIYQVSALYEAHLMANTISEILEISSKQAAFLIRNQIRDSRSVLMLLNMLAEIDQNVKLGKIDQYIAFELFLLQIKK